MARSYPKKVLVIIFSNVQILAVLMYAAAPFVQVFLRNFHFVIFGLEVNQYNGIAVVIAVILIVFEIISYFFLTDLTKDPGTTFGLMKQRQRIPKTI